VSQFALGQSVRRIEDPRLITGCGRFTDDVAVPGALHGYVLRSPFAHADIVRLDVDAARRAPGVVGVVTIADLDAGKVGNLPCSVRPKNRDGSDMAQPPRPALARGRVRHVGEPVAFVVAETVNLAKDAAELIEVDYDALDVVAETCRANAPGRSGSGPRRPAISRSIGATATRRRPRPPSRGQPVSSASTSSTTGSSSTPWSRARRSAAGIRSETRSN
jgi:carbon-monoxide dehydrogenase large subunit